MASGPTNSQPLLSGSTRGWSPTSAKLKLTDLTTSEASTTAPISFTSVEELFDLLKSTTGDYIQVNQVSVDSFHAIQRARESECRKFRLFYDQETTCLIITLPTMPHEFLHVWLNRRIGQKADAMGVGEQLEPIGAPTYTSSGNLISLEGDSCWAPLSRLSGPDCWPVLVIEAGYSQSVRQLRTKARTWFLISNFEVKIVILAKMFASDGRIVLEKWKGVQAGGRAGTIRTRQQSRRVPECVHTTEISRPGITNEDPRSTSPESYRVSRGALRLEFEDIFLRSAGAGEADIVIAEEELQQFASRVWTVPR